MQTNRTRPRAATITTHEGARAVRIDRESQLRRSVMSCMLFEDEFYESGVSIAKRIGEAVAAVDLEVASKIAIEAREQMYLRHVPLWIVREMARRVGPKAMPSRVSDPAGWARMDADKQKAAIVGDTLARVIQRADELTEFVALYWKDGRRPLTGQMKRGLAEAFTKFDAYGLAKYDRDNKAVRLRDVLFLSHAKAKDEEQAALWKLLAEDKLPTPDTWEVELSGGGGQNKLESWTRLLTERKLGGLALLRNLRNMQQAGVDEALVREAIADNKFKYVLPFRFIAAAMHAPHMEDALEQAMFRAAADMPKLKGRTVLLIDISASMGQNLSAKSEMTRFDAAAGLAMLLRETADDLALYGFSSECFRIPARRGMALREAVKARVIPQGTLLGAAKRKIDADGRYDRIIVITDEQSHDQPTAPLGKGYVINVGSYRNGIGYGPWLHIDGWSEAVIRYIQAYEASEVSPEAAAL